MRVTRRQLRKIIREAASAPSLESLFIGNTRYGVSRPTHARLNLQKDINTLAEEIPGLEQKIRKILGPSSYDPPPRGWGPWNLYQFLGNHVDDVYKKTKLKPDYDEDGMLIPGTMGMTQEWAEFGLDLIRQAGIEEEILNLNRSLEEAEKERLAKEEAEKEAAELLGPQVPIDTNTGTGLTVDAMGADDAVDSVSGDATDPVFLRQLAGWLKKMDKNPAVQMIMFNMD